MQHKLILRNIAANVLTTTGLIRLLQKQSPNAWRILMYHRVIAPDDVPYPMQPGMYVTPDTFQMQMEVLRKHASVLPLDELAGRISAGTALPQNAVAISFDDGWSDNYEHAYPILRRLNLPATIFLATSFIDSANCFWTDELPAAIAALRSAPQHLPTALLRINEHPDVDQKHRSLLATILSATAAAELPAAIDSLIASLKQYPLKERTRLIRGVITLAKEFTTVRLKKCFLTWAQVEEMSRHGISFGSHTHTHQRLSELTPEQVKDEIENSYQMLRAHVATLSAVFCYPEGAYTEATQQILHAKSIRFALSTKRQPELTARPALLSRIGIHQDVAGSAATFRCRVWADTIF